MIIAKGYPQRYFAHLRDWFNLCYYCKICPATTKDHLYPKSKGGQVAVPCCSVCNMNKGTMTADEYKNLLRSKTLLSKRIWNQLNTYRVWIT